MNGLRMALALVVSVTVSGSAWAADVVGEPPKIGEKVRVDYIAKVQGERDSILRDARVTGRLAAMDSVSWRIEYWTSGMPVTDPPLIKDIPLQDFERIRIRDGRSHARAGMWGALWGFAAGSIAAVMIRASQEDESEGDRHNPEALWAIPAGAAIGLVIGSTMTVDTWRDYPVPHVFGPSAARVKP